MSKQPEGIQLVVDSKSEQKAVPPTSTLDPTTVSTLYIGGMSIFTKWLKRKSKIKKTTRVCRRIFYVSFCPCRDDTWKPSHCVVAVCGLLAKCEAKWPTCCFWNGTFQDGWCSELQWMPCKLRAWSYWVTPLNLWHLNKIILPDRKQDPLKFWACQRTTKLNCLLLSLSDCGCLTCKGHLWSQWESNLVKEKMSIKQIKWIAWKWNVCLTF